MCANTFDGRVDTDFHGHMAADWREEQSQRLQETDEHRSADNPTSKK
jgi:hypothetical protein